MAKDTNMQKYVAEEQKLMASVKEGDTYIRFMQKDDNIHTSLCGNTDDIMEGIAFLIEQFAGEFSDNPDECPTFGWVLGRIADYHEMHQIDNFTEFVENAMAGMDDDDDEDEDGDAAVGMGVYPLA